MPVQICGVDRTALITQAVAGSLTLNAATRVAYVDTSAARSVDLPTAACYNGNIVQIVDATGGAGLNNITVTTQGAETISGLASFVIATALDSATFVSDGANWFVEMI